MSCVQQLEETIEQNLEVLAERRLFVPQLAWAISFIAEVAADADQPMFNDVGSASAEFELQKLEKLVADLHAHIPTLHRNVRKALRQDHPDDEAGPLSRGETWLNEMMTTAQHARLKLSPSESRKGRPRRQLARYVAEVSADAYRMLTCQEPTATGRFVPFLGGVFEVLGIEASAAGQAKSLLG